MGTAEAVAITAFVMSIFACWLVWFASKLTSDRITTVEKLQAAHIAALEVRLDELGYNEHHGRRRAWS